MFKTCIKSDKVQMVRKKVGKKVREKVFNKQCGKVFEKDVQNLH